MGRLASGKAVRAPFIFLGRGPSTLSGRGLDAALLAHTARRTLESPPATAFALVVDAKNNEALAFYQHHGFTAFASQLHTLFLPLATAATALPEPEKK